MSYKYCGLNGLQWAHRAFVVLFIMLPDVPVKNQNRVDTNNILLGRLYSRFEPPPAINSDPLVATGVLNSGGFRQNPRLIDYDSSMYSAANF